MARRFSVDDGDLDPGTPDAATLELPVEQWGGGGYQEPHDGDDRAAVGVSLAVASCVLDGERSDPESFFERYALLVDWVEALRDAGAGPIVVLQRYRRDAVLHREGIEYRFVSDGHPEGSRALFLGERMARAAAALAPDVVHVEGLVFPLFVGCLRLFLARRSGIVVQDHGGIHAGSPGFRRRAWRAWHRAGLRAGDAFFFTARELSTPWRQAGIIGDGQDVFEVPESSTTLASGSRGPSSAGLRGSPALLWVGRLDENKDPLTVLEAFSQVLADLPDAVLTMVFGASQLLPQVRGRLERDRALQARVDLRGEVEWRALAPFYESADLFVLGSHHESCGFALLEALAFGVAPVVSDIPSHRVLTDGGRLGGLFAPGDAAALASTLVAVARSGRARSRDSVRDHFARELSWPAVARKAASAYEAVSAARLGRPHHASGALP